ncbi:hypothetical protein G4V39_00845 [Thermosulfuriphilus ammonigenes]|uniref:Uncharacterized protein n=1 Tax=Thermosulfuriphilus ammonigenes TaxID=1936021 RepID=A0A6G7PT98_9BACT|nr:hypothetical protein [Thermosulfuriphilus ammonigenes]MBA2848982.1 hypothetical protein [Thermosulfuriphilus ammonigenes]QIJ70904.1 hypothetical protein G4V39_00845 [Thermosulfuriphilus ammonigenes]
MSGQALLFMLFSWCFVASLTTFCFTRLFMGKKKGSKSDRCLKEDR